MTVCNPTTSQIGDVVIRPLKQHGDARGWLVELYREDELAESLHPVMAYVSQTQPGVTRGPHEHVDQTDYFAFIGPGDFELILWDARPESPTHGLQTAPRSRPTRGRAARVRAVARGPASCTSSSPRTSSAARLASASRLTAAASPVPEADPTSQHAARDRNTK